MVTGPSSFKPYYEVVSDCPRCGAPIYVDKNQLDQTAVPTPFYTCNCRFNYVTCPPRNGQQLLTEVVSVPTVWVKNETANTELTAKLTVTDTGPFTYYANGSAIFKN